MILKSLLIGLLTVALAGVGNAVTQEQQPETYPPAEPAVAPTEEVSTTMTGTITSVTEKDGDYRFLLEDTLGNEQTFTAAGQGSPAGCSAGAMVTVKRCNLTNSVTALSNPNAANVRVDVWKH